MQRRALYLEGVHPELLEVPQVRPVESGDDEEKLLDIRLQDGIPATSSK